MTNALRWLMVLAATAGLLTVVSGRNPAFGWALLVIALGLFPQVSRR